MNSLTHLCLDDAPKVLVRLEVRAPRLHQEMIRHEGDFVLEIDGLSVYLAGRIHPKSPQKRGKL